MRLALREPMQLSKAKLSTGIINVSTVQFIFLLFSLLSNRAYAGSTEPYPGGFDPAPAGTNVASLYLYQREVEGYYFDGKPMFGGGKFDLHAEVLGFTHFGKTGELASKVGVLLPYISAHKTEGTFPAGLGEEFSGVSDPRLIYTLWPMISPERTIAISGTLFVPIGDYDNSQVINAGDNRWKGVLQLGLVEKIAPNFKVDIVPEMTVYGKNSQYLSYTMTQENAYALTTFLRWRALPMLETDIGYQLNAGGSQTVSGKELDNAPRNQRLFMGVTANLAKHVIVGVRYSQDVVIKYDFKTTAGWVLHMHYVF